MGLCVKSEEKNSPAGWGRRWSHRRPGGCAEQEDRQKHQKTRTTSKTVYPWNEVNCGGADGSTVSFITQIRRHGNNPWQAEKGELPRKAPSPGSRNGDTDERNTNRKQTQSMYMRLLAIWPAAPVTSTRQGFALSAAAMVGSGTAGGGVMRPRQPVHTDPVSRTEHQHETTPLLRADTPGQGWAEVGGVEQAELEHKACRTGKLSQRRNCGVILQSPSGNENWDQWRNLSFSSRSEPVFEVFVCFRRAVMGVSAGRRASIGSWAAVFNMDEDRK